MYRFDVIDNMNFKAKVMFKRNTWGLIGWSAILLIGLGSCNSDDNAVADIPFTADVFNSVNGRQVAFQGITNNAVSWSWDFGDGNTSTSQNPVHRYAEGGYYVATLTATDENGATLTSEVSLALDLPPYALLVGNQTEEGYDGKTWRISSEHSAFDYFAFSDADLTLFDGTPAPLPAGIFGSGLGMGEIYNDEFTFYFDGSYKMDLKEDGTAFSGLVFQFLSFGGANIRNLGGEDFGLCTAAYTPAEDATFIFTESEDMTTTSAFGPGGMITYEGVTTLDFSGTEFVGFWDYENKVILQDITNSTMRLVVFVAASPDVPGINTNAIILTFEAVD